MTITISLNVNTKKIKCTDAQSFSCLKNSIIIIQIKKFDMNVYYHFNLLLLIRYHVFFYNLKISVII